MRVTHSRCRVSSDGGAGPSVSDDELSRLQSELADAVANERYAEAAALRDRLRFVKQDIRAGVEQANARFYRAFESGDAAGMASVWGVGEHVRCLHPGAECITGREAVLASWALVSKSGPRLRVRAESVDVFSTERLAFLTCVEVVDAPTALGRLACTNVFELQEGEWRIIHHHASPV